MIFFGCVLFIFKVVLVGCFAAILLQWNIQGSNMHHPMRVPEEKLSKISNAACRIVVALSIAIQQECLLPVTSSHTLFVTKTSNETGV